MDSIYENSSSCYLAFQNVLSKLSSAARSEYGEQMPPAQVEEEYGRFKIWLGNLGALQRGHASLDYRVRESAVMRTSILKLLQQLHTNLSESISVLNGTRLPFESSEPDWSSDEEISNDSSEDEGNQNVPEKSELKQRLHSIIDIISDLYKLSFKIRNPSMKPRPGKASMYSEVDEETGVELFSEYLKFDRSYITECVQQMRRSSSRNTAEHDYLVDRLAHTVTARRRQFRYWRRHGSKLARYSEAHDYSQEAHKSSSHHDVKDPQAVLKEAHKKIIKLDTTPSTISKSIFSGTEATTYDKKLDDMLENQSVISYATTVYDSEGKTANLPAPPVSATKGAAFVCPYCLVLCPPKHGSGRAWRTHILHDLQPYVCTYPDCTEKTYSSRRQWLEHEGSVHRKVWRCFQHPSAIFISATAYQDHLRAAHSDEFEQRNDVLDVAETYLNDERDTCPLCLQTVSPGQAFHHHLAYHLETMACFALPKGAQADEEDSQAGSNAPQAWSDESRPSVSSGKISFDSKAPELASSGTKEADGNNEILDERITLPLADEQIDNIGDDYDSAVDPVYEKFDLTLVDVYAKFLGIGWKNAITDPTLRDSASRDAFVIENVFDLHLTEVVIMLENGSLSVYLGHAKQHGIQAYWLFSKSLRWCQCISQSLRETLSNLKSGPIPLVGRDKIFAQHTLPDKSDASDSESDVDLFAVRPQRNVMGKGKEKAADGTAIGAPLHAKVSEQSLECPIEGCSATFDRPGDFNLHMKQHGAPDFVCNFSECGKRFYRFNELRDHIRSEHRVDSINVERLVQGGKAVGTPIEPAAGATSASDGRSGFIKGELLGVGSWSKARSYLGMDTVSGELLVVKEVHFSEDSIERTAEDGRLRMRQDLVNQLISIVLNLEHPNVVKYHGFQLVNNTYSILMEYVPGGTLEACLRKYGKFPSTLVSVFARQILKGLTYLHSNDILHRDLTANKVLLDYEGTCKISWSFMMEKVNSVYTTNESADARIGSVYWMAPEVIRSQGKSYSGKADIWSLGCLVLQLLSGHRPFSKQEVIGAIYKIGTLAEAPPIPDDIINDLDVEALAFLYDCWTIDPTERPTANTLLRAPYLLGDPKNPFEKSDIYAKMRADLSLGTGQQSSQSPSREEPTVSSEQQADDSHVGEDPSVAKPDPNIQESKPAFAEGMAVTASWLEPFSHSNPHNVYYISSRLYDAPTGNWVYQLMDVDRQPFKEGKWFVEKSLGAYGGQKPPSVRSLF